MPALNTLTNEELLRHAYAQQDALTSTEVEVELLKRFGALIDEHDAGEEQRRWLEKVDFDPSDSTQRADVETAPDLVREFPHWDISGLLGLLSEYDLDNPGALRQVLERDHAMQSLLDDIADPIARLHSLANPAPATAANPT